LSFRRARRLRRLHSFPTRRSSDLDAALFGDERRHLRRHPKSEGDLLAGFLATDDLGQAIDMARHDMPAQLVPDLQRAFEIDAPRSEEHTSELQSRENLVCRLLLEK